MNRELVTLNKSLLVVGECMMELVGDPLTGSLNSGFAGDTYNAAVYAKRYAKELKVSYLTAVGNDFISSSMLDHLAEEDIDTTLILKSEHAHLGSYFIHTDSEGERSFVYWRNKSAATELMQLLNQSQQLESLHSYDYLFFSGISLAILSDTDKSSFLDLLIQLRRQGTVIAFDPNYRSSLWESTEHAREWMRRAYLVTDIALPGLEDHATVFNHKNHNEVFNELLHLGVNEIIVKCGEDGVYAMNKDCQILHTPFRPVENQVDSTAAGDSFSGTYIASRLSGQDVQNSIETASEIARLVIRHPGAIVEPKIYRNHRLAQ